MQWSVLWYQVWHYVQCWRPPPNITLDRLTQFIEVHYEQKYAHDLCNTMTKMLQFPKKSVYTFVMQCLEVREKILPVSEKSCDLSYFPGFINKLLLRTIEWGVSNPFVVQEIKLLLRSEKMCDKALLAAIIKASASKVYVTGCCSNT